MKWLHVITHNISLIIAIFFKTKISWEMWYYFTFLQISFMSGFTEDSWILNSASVFGLSHVPRPLEDPTLKWWENKSKRQTVSSIIVNIVGLTGPWVFFWGTPGIPWPHFENFQGRDELGRICTLWETFEHRWSLSVSVGLAIRSGWDAGPGGQMRTCWVRHGGMKWPRGRLTSEVR